MKIIITHEGDEYDDAQNLYCVKNAIGLGQVVSNIFNELKTKIKHGSYKHEETINELEQIKDSLIDNCFFNGISPQLLE